ncbi:MAG: 50S ribosomal protein L22 [Ignavibacteriales bacterium]|nr:50S ribosomal protein L22 [Ignavibacteriales bacterium]MBI3788972.1 50S ribosomal protein L22 [Ignavibacteriales bacterium]
MEARAINRFVGTSPRKMMLVIDLIRGHAVEDALTMLHFSPKHAARTAEKVLRSAISNIQNKDEAGRVDTATLFVKEAYVNGGPSMKRVLPAPMGRAFKIRKRSNHITIVIAQREVKVKATPPQAKAVPPEPKTEKTEQASAKSQRKKSAKKETKSAIASTEASAS